MLLLQGMPRLKSALNWVSLFFVNTQLSVKSWCETKIQTDIQNEK